MTVPLQQSFLQVLNRKSNIPSFIFRLNSLEYQNLQDKINGTITNLGNIQVYKTVSERFVDVFKEQISEVRVKIILKTISYDFLKRTPAVT